jgi:hypothetical protein
MPHGERRYLIAALAAFLKADTRGRQGRDDREIDKPERARREILYFVWSGGR